jgi:hypothetical protein
MTNDAIPSDGKQRLQSNSRRSSAFRGFIVSVGGILFMFCCLTILTVSACNLTH